MSFVIETFGKPLRQPVIATVVFTLIARSSA